MQSMASRLDAILSLALGGGSTIPGTSLSLSSVPAQISTLNNTQSTQGTTLNTLNTRPINQQVYYGQRTTPMSIASGTFADQTVQTLVVPTRTWDRLLIVYMASTWGWSTATTTNTLRSRMKIDSASRTEAMQNGPNVTLSAFFTQLLFANNTATIAQTINCYQANQSSTAQTQEMDPIIIAIAIPFFGTGFSSPVEI
jgi:hypothetical protein